jgi:uncharacterized protein
MMSSRILSGAHIPATRLADPVLVRFRQALTVPCSPKLERIARYGSRARGDARPDYDIAVFIYEPENFGDEAGRLATIETDILYNTGAAINSRPFHAGAYLKRTGSMSELCGDGIDLRSRKPGIVPLRPALT